MRRLHDAFRYTTVYVTHDQSEAMTTADVICVMNLGKIEQAGSPEEIYDRPRSEFVARFIGMSNVFKGKALDSTRVSFAGVPLRVTGEPLQPNGETAVSIRQHQIELLATEPTAKDNVVPATVIRQVFLGSSRDYMVEVADGTQLRVVTAADESVAPGATGVARIAAANAAGRWPDRTIGTQAWRATSDRGRKRRWRGHSPDAMCSRLRARWRSALPARVRSARRAAAERDHARADRGRARRKARSSSTPRSTCRWPRRSPRRSRRNIPALRCASSAPAPSACSSASARSTPAASIAVDVVNTSDAAHLDRLEARRLACALRARGRGEALSRPSTRTRTACSPASASRFARSPTTPTW